MRGPPSLQARRYWQRLTSEQQEQRLQQTYEKRQSKRRFPGLSQSEVISRNRSGYKSKEAWNRVCIVCNGTKTLLSRRNPDKYKRLDGSSYSWTPIWYRSDLMEGRFECKKCHDRQYYIKNKMWIQARQRRFREQRKRLMSKLFRSLYRKGKHEKN